MTEGDGTRDLLGSFLSDSDRVYSTAKLRERCDLTSKLINRGTNHRAD